MPNYYKILDIPMTATEDEIRRQFKALSLKWHPDKLVQGAPPKGMTSRQKEAYDTLPPESRNESFYKLIVAAHDALLKSSKEIAYLMRMESTDDWDRLAENDQQTFCDHLIALYEDGRFKEIGAILLNLHQKNPENLRSLLANENFTNPPLLGHQQYKALEKVIQAAENILTGKSSKGLDETSLLVNNKLKQYKGKNPDRLKVCDNIRQRFEEMHKALLEQAVLNDNATIQPAAKKQKLQEFVDYLAQAKQEVEKSHLAGSWLARRGATKSRLAKVIGQLTSELVSKHGLTLPKPAPSQKKAELPQHYSQPSFVRNAINDKPAKPAPDQKQDNSDDNPYRLD